MAQSVSFTHVMALRHDCINGTVGSNSDLRI
ncbi:hypothetical protein BURPS1655_F0254 [Burkholderia pseudomallei 1655]|nr:hypothetical protein BURPS1655_F0254 [Burkholderia pseudomallei 1655]